MEFFLLRRLIESHFTIDTNKELIHKNAHGGLFMKRPSWRVILVITLINRNLLSRAMEVHLSKDAHVGLFYKDAIRLF